MVPIDQLSTNGDWVRPLDPEHVHRLVEAKSWPPIHVTPAYEVVDGVHRLAAAAHLGLSEVEVSVLHDCQDTFAAREWHLLQNSSHGMPLNREHTIAVLMALIDDGCDRSDSSIARTTGVPKTQVAEARRRLRQRDEEWSTGSRGRLTTPVKTIGDDGRARPATEADRRAQEAAIRDALDPRTNPTPNFSAIAQEFGVARNTVKRVRRDLEAEPKARPSFFSWLWTRLRDLFSRSSG